MGIEVIIENKKSLFNKPKKLTKDNILAIFKDEIQLGYSNSIHSRWNPLKANENDIAGGHLTLVDMSSYGRGIEFYVAEDMSYLKCSLLVPTVKVETELFEEVVKTLANYMNCKEVTVEGQTVSIKDRILSDDNLEFAISRSLSMFLNNGGNPTLPCSFYPLELDEEFIDRLKTLQPEQQTFEFDKHLSSMLSEETFYADARLYNNDENSEKEYVAIYPIMDGYDIVIPTYDRYPNAESLVSGNVYPSASRPNGEDLGFITYDDFLNEAYKHKIGNFDSKHIIINLTNQAMIDIWQNNKMN